jgi:hypothetical protein
MANIVWGGFSHSTTKETQYPINNARNEVRDELMPGVDLSGHRTVKTAIEKNGAWGCENQWTAAFLSKMAPQCIHNHHGGIKEWVHREQTNADCQQ